MHSNHLFGAQSVGASDILHQLDNFGEFHYVQLLVLEQMDVTFDSRRTTKN